MVDAPVVEVRGEAYREVPPELARFAVTVSARDKDRQAALARLAERAAAVRALIDGYADAIERREAGDVHVYPELKRSGERVAAYVGSVTTTVTVTDFAVLGKLMMLLADRDQGRIAGPWWELRPGSPADREAREAAVADAVDRARGYAAAVGARLERLLEIFDEGGGRDRPMRSVAFESAESARTPELELDPRLQTVHAAVRVRFTISEPTALG